jgi:hypothetical protein
VQPFIKKSLAASSHQATNFRFWNLGIAARDFWRVLPDVPPLLSSRLIWNSIPPDQEIGREEAIDRRADHWLLREAEAGVAVKDLCRKHGFSDASYSLWRSKFRRHERAGAQRCRPVAG